MQTTRWIVVLLIFFLLPAKAKQSEQGMFFIVTNQVHIVSSEDIFLDVAFNFKRGVNKFEALAMFPESLAVLTGNFFSSSQKQLATMLIVDGRYYHAPTGIRNRPVLAQEHPELGGKIIITTEYRAGLNRHRYRMAMEAGPFLIANGNDFNDWDITDPTFYRSTYRIGVGLLANGDFFWSIGHGTLAGFRQTTKQALYGKTIKHFMLLDGGSSAGLHNRLPTRLVILPRE